MYSNGYKNEIINDEDKQRFRRIPSDWYNRSTQRSVPKLYEQSVTSTTTTTVNQESNTTTDEKTSTRLDKSPMRRVNLVTGPRSAFARLFPDKYRQEQRSRSTEGQRYNFDQIGNPHLINDDIHDYEDIRKSRKVSFSDAQTSNRYSSEQNLSRIPLNYDPNPEVIYRDNPDKLVYVQKVGVRYLKPPTPPPPEPIIIREIQATPPHEPPPLFILTTPPIAPRTPSPIIVREQPPIPPQPQPAKVITKTLPPLPTPPRRVIIKRVPPLPAKPRPVIIEKWLPYKIPAERPVVYERAEQPNQVHSSRKNVILQYQPASVRIEQQIQNVGCYRVDPELYRNQYGTSLRRTTSIRKVLEDIGCNPDVITSTGYQTCYTSNPSVNESHYDYPRQTRTCYTDEELTDLINSATNNQYQYAVPNTTSRYNDQTYYRTVLSNS